MRLMQQLKNKRPVRSFVLGWHRRLQIPAIPASVCVFGLNVR